MASEKSLKLFTISSDDSKKQDSTTVIDKLADLSLDDKRTVANPDDLTERDLAATLGDMEIEVQERTLLFDLYNRKFSNNIIEIVNKLNTMYLFSKTKLLEEYLYHIIRHTSLDPRLKIETAKTLSAYSIKGFECLEYVIVTYASIPTPIRLDSIYMLLGNESTMENAIGYYLNFLVDQSIECLYRYKSILNLEIHFKDKPETYQRLAHLAISTFLECRQNMTYYRILACQYFFNKCNSEESLKELCLNSLFGFAEDSFLDYNLRADAVDVLLNFEDREVVAKANRILMDLGSNGRTIRSIFENAQNVHQKSIEESARKIIEFLCTVPLTKKGRTVDYNWCCDRITEAALLRPQEQQIKISTALSRVLIDRAVYGPGCVTLETILVKLWAYIEDHESKSDLIQRLLDELIDSSDVCSTGYAHRMVNVLSGYTEMSLSISFEEQIIANLQGRLNAAIKAIEDVEFQSQIVIEMLTPVIHYHLRGNFLKFFREHISKIREGMYQEFRDHMSDTDYDLYFRKAIISYEGVDTA